MTAPTLPDPYRALACLLAAGALPCAAVGLGDLQVHSGLGEPLDATATIEAAADARPTSRCFRQGRVPAGELPALPRAIFSVEADGAGWRLRVRTRAPVQEPATRLRVDASCEDGGKDATSRTFDLLLDPRAPEPAPPAMQSVAGDTLASIAAAIYPKSRAVREAYVQALRAANPAVQSLGTDEPLPPGTPVVLPDLRRFSLSLSLPRPAATESTAQPPPASAPAKAKAREKAPPKAAQPPKTVEPRKPVEPSKAREPKAVEPKAPKAAAKPAPATAEAPAPKPEATPAAKGTAPAKPGEFVLRLSAPAVDLSRSRGIDDRTRSQLRERLLILDADDQVAALLAMRHNLKQLEGRVAELQLKLSTLPTPLPARPAEPAKVAEAPKAAEPPKAVEPPKAAEPPRSEAPSQPAKVEEPAKVPEPAKPVEAAKTAEAPKAPVAEPKRAPEAPDEGVPAWLWGVLALALGGIAAIAGKLLAGRKPAAAATPPAAPAPRLHSDLDDAEAMMGAGEAPPAEPGEHRVVASSDESLATSVRGADPAALRRRYIEERFPEIASGTIQPADPDSVVKAARLFYEDGALARAVELLHFSVEEDPASLKPWLALFEIFRLEGLTGEFGELAQRFREHHGSSEYWRKVQFIGREIDPANALYREAPLDHLETIGPAAARRAMPVTFDPLAENWLNAPMDFTTDALAASLRAGLLADAKLQDTDLVADPMPALKNVEMFNVA